MVDPFVEQVKQWCRDFPLVAKWVIVPEPGLGWTLGERLLLEGCNWVNLHWVTPFELALEAVAPQLLAQGGNPCPEGLGACLVQNLILQESNHHHFRPLILQPGMAEALWKTLCEFRLAGLFANDLDRLAPTPKILEFARLLRNYETCLKERGWFDRADIFRRAGLPSRLQGGDRCLVFPYTSWAPLEAAWMRQLPLGPLPRATQLQAPAGYWQRDPVLVEPPRPEVFFARRRQDEVEEILRRIGQEGIALDQVEIVTLPEEIPTLLERMKAVGFDCTVQAGVPLTSSRPGQAVTGLLDWIEEGFSAYRLRQMLLSELLSLPPSPTGAARILKSARIAWGPESFADGLCQLKQAYESKDWAELAQQTEQLSQALAIWFALLQPVQAAPWMEGLSRVIQEGVVVRSPGEERARDLILRQLQELAQLPGQGWDRGLLLEQVRQSLRGLQALSQRPQPGKIHLGRPTALGLSGRPHVFLVGLEEGRWFGAPPEDCILSDQARCQLNPGLARVADQPQSMEFQLRERMATCAGRLTLSFSLLDARGESEQIPSWFFLEWAGLDADSWSQAVTEARPLRIQAQVWPGMARGEQALQARSRELFTHYDGWVPAAAGVLDPVASHRAVTVSWLKDLATCPFRVFLQDGLGLRGGEPPLPNLDRWLDPATRGILVHQVLADYFVEEGLGLDHLKARLEIRLSELRRRMPPASAALERVEVEELHRDLERFWSMDEARTRPVEVEMPFELELGVGRQKMLFRGRVDRVDQSEHGYSVVDYKTGRNPSQLRAGGFDRGRQLQPALYALAVDQLMGPVVACAYSFVRADTQVRRLDFSPPPPSEVFRVLDLVLAPTRSGAFVQAQESRRDCLYCEVKAACRTHRDEQVAAKVANPDNLLLRARRQLLEEP